MVLDEILKMVIASALGGGTIVAIINIFGDGIKFKRERKAAKEDKEEAKKDRSEKNSEAIEQIQNEESERNSALEEHLQKIDDQIGNLTDAVRLILFDRLVQFGEYLISKGEVTFDQRHRFGQMYDEYHVVLQGNGDADFIRDAVNRLPMKYSEGEKIQY